MSKGYAYILTNPSVLEGGVRDVKENVPSVKIGMKKVG